MKNKKGQGLVEYTLLVLLIVLVSFVSLRNIIFSNSLTSNWVNVRNCLLFQSPCNLTGNSGNNGNGNDKRNK